MIRRSNPATGALAALLLALPAAGQDFYTDVRPVLVENCLGCHTESGPAWSMEDPEAAYARRERIVRAVTGGRMPPWLAESGHQTYVGDRSLDDEAVALIRAWAEAGYPRGEPRVDPPVPPRADHGHAFAPELSLEVTPPEGYLPDPDRSDDYHCFLVDWTGDVSTFVTGFRTVPGNRNVAHHLVVYAVDPAMWDRYKEVDAEFGDGPGYSCLGGAVSDELLRPEARAAYEERYPDGARELSRASRWLAHWAPGMDGHVFPEGTGIRIEPGAGLVVQMHYYASAGPGEKDVGTRMDFMTAPEVDRPAVNFDQTRSDWLSGERNGTMVIPPGETRTYALRHDMDDLVGYLSRVTGVPQDRIEALEIHSANLHMHAFGHSGEVTLTWPSGRDETLLSIPRWDLRWQQDFTFTEPKVIPREAFRDTSLGMRCTYFNDSETPVYGGLGSFDEMCFNFSYIAVREGEPATDGGR